MAVGRSVATLVVMLIAFAVFAALFIALDMASGVHVPRLLGATDVQRTPTPSATALAATPHSGPGLASATPRSGNAPTATVLSAVTPTQPGGPARSTPTASPAPPTATAAAPTASPTATPLPTPPGGVTPPRYGALLNYTNNTAFSPTFLQALDEEIITQTNRQRADHRLGALQEDRLLDVIAASRSQDLMQRHYFDHFDPTGPVDAQGHHKAAVQELLERNNVAYTEVGENLIANTGLPLDKDTPQEVVQAWMNHPDHRANILHATYTTIGVGMAVESRPEGLHVIITQVFVR